MFLLSGFQTLFFFLQANKISNTVSKADQPGVALGEGVGRLPLPLWILGY